MDTRYVQEFLTFATELNYSVAAKKLYITRPTLSEHIKELEDELGCELVGKNQGKAALTPAGKRFVKTGAQLLSDVRGIVGEYSALHDNLLTVTIAQTNLPWLESIIYKARYAIQERYPEKQIDIVTVNGPYNTVDALRDNVNDIVVAGYKSYVPDVERSGFPEGVQDFKLCTEEIKLFITQGNPLFTKNGIEAKDLDGATFMLPPDLYQSYLRDKVVARFEEHGARITLSTMSFADHFEYFTYDFSDTIGIVPTTLIPRFGIDDRDECRAFSLNDLNLQSDFFALYTDEFVENENAAALIAEIKRLAEEALG